MRGATRGTQTILLLRDLIVVSLRQHLPLSSPELRLENYPD